MISCQQDILTSTAGEAVLQLDLLQAGQPVFCTRSVDDGLVVRILRENGTEFMSFAASEEPEKIVLEPGSFIVKAYSPNQDDWKTMNGGKGEPCYYAETKVLMEYDAVTRLTLDVPMVNFAVSLQLPELWDNLFKSYRFTVGNARGNFMINQGEKVYFDVADGAFSYALSATNTDNVTHSHSAINFTEVAAGKLFTVKYSYDSDSTSGGVDIVITDDMEQDDTNVNL